MKNGWIAVKMSASSKVITIPGWILLSQNKANICQVCQPYMNASVDTSTPKEQAKRQIRLKIVLLLAPIYRVTYQLIQRSRTLYLHETISSLV